MTEIPHKMLSLGDVPPEGAGWDEVSRFALTHDAYQALGSFEAVADVANRKAPRSLEECRVCLFFEQRRWRHFGSDPDGDDLAYIHGLVRRIRDELRGSL